MDRQVLACQLPMIGVTSALAIDSAAAITNYPITNYQFSDTSFLAIYSAAAITNYALPITNYLTTVGIRPIDHPCVLTIFAGSVNFASPTSSVTM
jgi:hypothetical protein